MSSMRFLMNHLRRKNHLLIGIKKAKNKFKTKKLLNLPIKTTKINLSNSHRSHQANNLTSSSKK